MMLPDKRVRDSMSWMRKLCSPEMREEGLVGLDVDTLVEAVVRLDERGAVVARVP